MMYAIVMEPTEPLVDQNVAAEHLSVSPRTLEHWRRVNQGPPYVKLGTRIVRYRISEIQNWLASTTHTHQGEA